MAQVAAEQDMSSPNISYEVIAIFGPTASGKSAVGALVADARTSAVVSADALQVYRGIPIITNQPAEPTRLVAIRELDQEMSVGEYAVLAHSEIDELVAATGTAIVLGGTGLYFRAALADLAVPAAPSPGQRERIEGTYDRDRNVAFARLEALDPKAAARVDVNDRRRVVRALELAELGQSLRPAVDALWQGQTRRPTLTVGLDVPVAVLEQLIERRVDEMIAHGALAEARAAISQPISRTAERALGLRELVELPLEEARERLIVRTRRYAAYQRKWMRRIPELHLVDGNRESRMVATDILALAARQ